MVGFQELSGFSGNERVDIPCNVCLNSRSILVISARRNYKKNGGFFICHSCSSKNCLRPQNTKKYWANDDKKQKHSGAIKNSKAYYDAIKQRDMSKENNGMYGKKHSDETKKKMSSARIGRKQSQATIQKRKNTIKQLYKDRPRKQPLNRSVRGYLHFNQNWHYRVFKKDGFKCVKCISKNKIDAHHIKPLSKIIDTLLADKNLTSNEDKYDYLVTCYQIIDKDLKNGMTLCRSCHKKEHFKWGSHNAT